MNSTYFQNFNDIAEKEIAAGYHSKLIHTDNNTLNFIDVEAGAIVPLHQHIHQQLSFVLEGEFELVINGQSRILVPGVFAVIPPDTLHMGRAVTQCKLIDVFSPVREDYKNL